MLSSVSKDSDVSAADPSEILKELKVDHFKVKILAHVSAS